MVAEEVVAHARNLHGVRFAHQGRNVGSGLDCLGVLIVVSQQLNLRDAFGALLATHDALDYSKSPNGEYLLSVLSQLLLPITVEQLRAGDVAVFAWDNNPQHLAVMGNYVGSEQNAKSLTMIHAYAPARSVIEHRLDAVWRARIVACFRLPEAGSEFSG